ncbi:MAG: DUF3373 family protein, partial [Sulfurimonas sp.]|nr:DUF3373 family protein [Sulfurimonas sp.]
MNKPLLLSLAAATILTSSLNAESMYERIQLMELQMKQMQEELVTLKSKDTQEADEEEETSQSANDADEDDEGPDSDDDSEDDTDSDEEDEDDDEETVEERLADLEESVTDLNKATNGSHLKFGVDYRFAVDNMQYKMAGKDINGNDTQGNDAFMTNRLWINMNWKATDNLSFTGQLAYNKAFGQRSDNNSNSTNPGYNFENFDWIANENAYDDIVRVRSAYFLYRNDTFLGSEIPWTFSIGRRPSTNGHLINLREDDGAASPMGHSINVEFDGLSSKFSLENLIGLEGMYIKLCAGRGLTNASHKFTAAPYATDSNANPDIDLLGLIFVPYDNGQYAIGTQYYYANNLIDQQFNGSGIPQDAFETVGGLHSFTGNFTMSGIGDEWSDYLDDTFFFVSAAVSITDPKDRSSESAALGYDPTGMLGSSQSEIGYSAWIGLQMPSLFTEDGKWGVEYNKGSRYWRSITYAEDTNIGSKIATRGDAYEVYFTEPLIEDILTFQVR